MVGDLAKRAESIEKNGGMLNLMTAYEDGEGAIETAAVDVSNSPLHPASGWQIPVADGALEFTIVLNKGLTRRMALVLPNEDGVYQTIKIYKNKKSPQPLAVLEEVNKPVYVLDELPIGDTVKTVYRMFQCMEISASHVGLYVGAALDIANSEMFSPQSLYDDVIKNVGYVPAVAAVNAKQPEYVSQLIIPTWQVYNKWQADAINHIIDHYGIEVVFSHLHNLDTFGHRFMAYGTEHEDLELGAEPTFFRDAYYQCYEDTDLYFGYFMHYLDEGWTIFIVSDHGLLLSENRPTLLGDPFGVNVSVMEELGYTVLKRDENGQPLKAIDWDKTTALAPRGNMIYLNLKGRANMASSIRKIDMRWKKRSSTISIIIGINTVSGSFPSPCAIKKPPSSA